MASTTLSSDLSTSHAPAHIDVGDTIIRALIARKVTTVYGVPGTWTMGLFDKIERESGMQLVCTGGEEGAAFAADAEARLKGLGVCVVTHGVGALKILNAASGARAGRSPLLVISGSPSPVPLGMVRQPQPQSAFFRQRSMFADICVATEVLDSAENACGKIERLLDAVMGQSMPGYLEVPWDCVYQPVGSYRPCSPFVIKPPKISKEDKEAAMILLGWLRALKRPVVWAGIEVHRTGFGLQKLFHMIIEREGWKVATSVTGKSVISDSHVLSLGVYAGAMSSDHVREEVEGCDGLLIIGMPLSDIDTGMFTSKVNPKACAFVDMTVGMQCDGAESKTLTPAVLLHVWKDVRPPPPRTFSRNFLLSYEPTQILNTKPKDERITTKDLIAAIDTIVTNDTVVLADVGVALFSAINLLMPSSNQFLSSGFWPTTGYALAGAIGAWFACKKRPIVLIGDEALLNCTNELATLARYEIPALVVVFDNGGCSFLRPSATANNAGPPLIDHVSLANAMGLKAAERATNEEDLWQCLYNLFSERSGPTLLSVCLDSSLLVNGTASSLAGLHDNAKKRKASPSTTPSTSKQEQEQGVKQARVDCKSYVTPDIVTS